MLGLNQHLKDIYDKVVEIVCDKLGVAPDEVTMDSHMTNDLGADSLDLIELIMEAEKEWNMAIPDDDAENIRIIGEAVTYIARKLNVDEMNSLSEEMPEDNYVQPEIEPFHKDKEHRFLTEVRRFRITVVPEMAAVNFTICEVGDILEERFDNPNIFVNVTKKEREEKYHQYSIDLFNAVIGVKILDKVPVPVYGQATNVGQMATKNRAERHNHNIDVQRANKEFIAGIEAIESIPAKESILFTAQNIKNVGSAYKRKMKSLAKLNEDLTALRFLLDIEEEGE